MTAAVRAVPARHGASSRYRYLVLGLLTLAYTLNYLDRQILVILAEPVRRDLGLTDTQLGLLTGLSFALFYSAAVFPIARFADRGHRVRVVACACAVWSFFSAACGLAGNFVHLALARVGVGVGEAGGTAPSYSILSDYFAPHERARALAIYSLGVPFGLAAGAAIGAGVAASYGWRASFFVVGLPGLIIALLIVTLIREPRRGAMEVVSLTAADRPSATDALARFVRDPVLRWITAATALNAFVGYGSSSFIPAFLVREQGMTLSQIAHWYSISFAIATGGAALSSGWLADRLASRDPRAYALIPLWGGLASVPFSLAGYLVHTWQASVVLLGGALFFGSLWLAPALAVVQNRASPHARSIAAAALLFVMTLVGLGGGPLFVGAISDALAPQYGGRSLRYALLAMIGVALAGVVLCCIATRALARDAAARAL